MNRHFEDARYYLQRAAEATAHGIRTELEPAERNVRRLTGMEREPEPSAPERVRERATDAERRARRTARKARRRIRRSRSS
ncbi:DUF7553 family protein [Halobacterium zhouii]|uniref:DUF7553 family protein n=1 Tax=Halobacterium zhouii TaxID=2902624 RepID=UPI001E571A83|nr:hypothetical protein [Halobacterium zhouii]